MSKRLPVSLQLTLRAAIDIQAIVEYSTERWGKRIASRYLDALQAGLSRLAANPELCTSEPVLHATLRFYRISQHLIICDVEPWSIVVLTVLHCSMDIPQHLAELQPTLAAEVRMLHAKFRQD